jgi:multimeric flavodoxin WrbA
MTTLVVVNGSYRREGVTTRCLEAVSGKLAEKHKLNIVWFHLDDDLRACVHCDPGECILGCKYEDQFQEIYQAIDLAERVLIGSPVYLDFPTPKVLALLSRLNSCAENTQRRFFEGKIVHLHANGYVSGTKSVIKSLMSACEMLGFTIEGRNTTEYIEKWDDKKIRGGMRQEDACYLD